ncbi:MAG: uracil-DNA glycosylase family protein [Sphingomicrobium sp.]|nr:uracil-DNA glycosylase [Sphingomonadales bacterium]
MVETRTAMGGSIDQLTRHDAARLLSWWLDAGVDTAISEEPRQWLKAASPAPRTEVATEIATASPNELPSDFNAFRAYLESATGLPLDRAGARRVLPHGVAGAKIMLLSGLPEREDASDGRPIGGEAWSLMTRMLAAIGLTPDEAYCASLACFHLPGGRLEEAERERCGAIARRHVELVKPGLLLLLGDAPCRTLLGEDLRRARGRVHKIEGVRAVATFHPRWLLQRPADKALAWRDLLLLTEES